MAFENLSPVLIALLRFGARVLAQWWKDNFQSSEEISPVIAEDSQRSPTLYTPAINTHTVLPPTTHPVLIISYPSEATIQLFDYAQQVSPELILYLCSFGVLCFIFLCVFVTFKLGKRAILWTFGPFFRGPRTHPRHARPPTNRQLSDIARHWFHFVRDQNPELTGEYQDLYPPQRMQLRRQS